MCNGLCILVAVSRFAGPQEEIAGMCVCVCVALLLDKTNSAHSRTHTPGCGRHVRFDAIVSHRFERFSTLVHTKENYLRRNSHLVFPVKRKNRHNNYYFYSSAVFRLGTFITMARTLNGMSSDENRCHKSDSIFFFSFDERANRQLTR